jgi:hypothetical protein
MAKSGQVSIPGMEPKRDSVVHPLALAYGKADDVFQRAKAKRDEARLSLVTAMQRRKMAVYRYDDVTVELVERTNVKVRFAEESEEEEGGD